MSFFATACCCPRRSGVPGRLALLVAFACDGPPEAAEVAGRYFRALRQLGVIGSLHIAHVTKSDGGDRKPFGSRFWHNGARSTWFIKQDKGAPDGSEVTVGLYNRKANLGPRRSAVGLKAVFRGDETSIQRVDIAHVPELAVDLSLPQRVLGVLSAGRARRPSQ